MATQVAARCRDGHFVVLDNFEHVVGGILTKLAIPAYVAAHAVDLRRGFIRVERLYA